jgi:putative transposase
MKKRQLIERDSVPPEHLDFTKWPTVLVDALSPEDQEKYYRRKRAVELYLRGETSLSEIVRETAISKSELLRHVRRCLQVDSNGTVWGFRALIPGKHIKPYERRKALEGDPNPSGAFELLLNTYPSIRDEIERLYLGRKDRGPKEPVMSVLSIWRRFVNACRAVGIKVTEYPFTTKDLGKRSLERYLKNLESRYFTQVAGRHGEEASRHARFTGRGAPLSNLIVRPFQRVVFDGHRIDALFAVEFSTPEGDTIVKIINRLWLLIIMDIATRSVLGHHISFNKEYTAVDVLACIRNAIVPWRPKKLTIPGLRYPERGGYPSGIFDEAKWAAWDEFALDNGKAHLSNLVLDRLTGVVGCTMNFGPVKLPERRFMIEIFFNTLEEYAYRRLPSTTGSQPRDPRRRNPEEAAVKYRISAEHLMELTEICIAQYNGTPHHSLNGLSPLEAMEQRIARYMPIRQIDEKREEVGFLMLQATRKVSGNIKTGKRPYVLYENVRYRNEVLAESPELIGTELTLIVDADDVRHVRAFLPDGSELGVLTATGKWGIVPHSLQTRKEIYSLIHRRLLHIASEDDPIQVYLQYLRDNSNNRKNSGKLARVQHEVNRSFDTKMYVEATADESEVHDAPAMQDGGIAAGTKDNREPIAYDSRDFEPGYRWSEQAPRKDGKKRKRAIIY